MTQHSAILAWPSLAQCSAARHIVAKYGAAQQSYLSAGPTHPTKFWDSYSSLVLHTEVDSSGQG